VHVRVMCARVREYVQIMAMYHNLSPPPANLKGSRMANFEARAEKLMKTTRCEESKEEW
jgi:hypothetical protein